MFLEHLIIENFNNFDMADERQNTADEKWWQYLLKVRILQPVVWIFKLFKWLFTAPVKEQVQGSATNLNLKEADVDGTINSYIKERWLRQRDYHSKKSNKAQKCYYGVQIAILALSAASSWCMTFSGEDLKIFGLPVVKAVCGFCSVSVMFLTGLNTLKQWREDWARSRNTTENLKSEMINYKMESGGYENKDNKDKILVQNVESIVLKDVEKFVSIRNQN